MASLERLKENQVSALRSYQNSTPVKGIWKAADCRGRGPQLRARGRLHEACSSRESGWKSYAG